MTNHNAPNERIKRQYFAYLAEALGHSEQSIDAAAKAIARFESFTRYKDFKAFHIEQARAFKRDLAGQRGDRSGDPLSKATLYATLTALKRFFIWLAGQPSYKSRISYSDAEYFNLSAKESRIAKTTRPARVPSLEQIRHVLKSMLALLGGQRRRTVEEHKTWSQNLGHEHVLTTFCSYGEVSWHQASRTARMTIAARCSPVATR
jgi:hypothetical protein